MATVKIPWPVPLPEPDTTDTVTILWDEPAVVPPGDDFRAMSQVPASAATYTPSPAAWPQQVAGTMTLFHSSHMPAGPAHPQEDPPWWPLLLDTSEWWSPQEWPGQRVLLIAARYEDAVPAHIDVAAHREVATHNPDLADAVVVYLPRAGEEIPPGAKAAIIAAVESGLPVTFRRLAGR